MRRNFSIREASTADIPTINRLAAAIWEPTYRPILSQEQIDYMFEVIYTPEALERQMQEGQTFLLLLDGSGPIGFAAFSLKDAADQVYKLNKIYLLPSRQGGGLGKLLLENVEEKVKQAGARYLDLNVNRYNQAKAFYERCGYQVHQEEDIPIGPYWMNDYVMRKQLA
ncbi:GNAT family N-acetyltransferase [Pontibacter ramchanderi]|uniref:N-acetylglutamate synthase-like GNAT family acetyltransferase n=1 Tax=Pontibacter ramchanderi TaxID=1179743 RepID=A0A2N3U957_9BACT|nr:GNAT family N-acetyltransferase [Pontibacter ramchanderi]PKV63298.1 N-acetylglutamate synthase-like GNAT family acetyltransferase [Pontibacter ramchanderi]